MRHLRIDDIQKSEDYEGKNNLRKGICLPSRAALTFPKFESVGLVKTPTTVLAQLCKASKTACEMRASRWDRFVTLAGPTRISVFIMPDNSSNGALEKLMHFPPWPTTPQCPALTTSCNALTATSLHHHKTNQGPDIHAFFAPGKTQSYGWERLRNAAIFPGIIPPSPTWPSSSEPLT